MNNNTPYTLGSLFDGSGGFPLAGTLCGAEPRWASEVEPYPIAVTKQRFTNSVHLGDISKINGAEIEPVDIITFGSPCQDLSVAGKRAGLKHEANGDEETTRSGLFMEAVRIIREMRIATNGEYPTFALWENVPGAFSSNKGEDFRIVCEELIKIVEPSAVMPEVPKNGWAYADSYSGDGWSLAYRTFDAQYWGVPQRRRRIHLIADFRGERAREVLFEREGVRGYFAQGRTPWQTAPADAQGSSGANDREGEGFDGYNGDLTGNKSATLGVNCGISTGRNGVIERGRQVDDVTDRHILDDQGGQQISVRTDGKSPTLRAETHGNLPCVVYYVENHPADSRVNIDESGKCQCLTSRMGTGGGNVPMVMEGRPVYCLQGNGIDRAETAGCNGKGWREDASYTLNTIDHPSVVYAVDQGGGKSSANVTENKSPTLCTTHGGEPVIALDRASFNQGQNAKYDFEITDSGVNSTIVAKGPSAVAYALDQQGGKGGANYAENVMPTLCSDSHGTPHAVAYPEELHNFIADYNADVPHQQDLLQTADGVSRPLVAATHGAASHHTKTVIYEHPHYIVRRLTPTECARLQGFADGWGVVEKKDSLTDEEYKFWLDVRHTYEVVVKGKKLEELKDYTAKQMLTWYNKLHTDSAEYKMWGNGIALPPALYCMQGMVDALNSERKGDADAAN